jgi:hypothetical protein
MEREECVTKEDATVGVSEWNSIFSNYAEGIVGGRQSQAAIIIRSMEWTNKH